MCVDKRGKDSIMYSRVKSGDETCRYSVANQWLIVGSRNRRRGTLPVLLVRGLA